MQPQTQPNESETAKDKAACKNILRLAILFGFAWTLLMAGSLAANLYQVWMHTKEAAIIQARGTFEDDTLYRRWNAKLGGVYAPVSDFTPPNPYLLDIEREIKTPSGQLLTKINPDYMTRQVHELAQKASGISGHLTSLDPLRPENIPDTWETNALESFQKGASEVSEFVRDDGNLHLRFMRPLHMEKDCLQCHAMQGYEEGVVRGGISSIIPMAPYMPFVYKRFAQITGGHILLWLVGFAALLVSVRRVCCEIRQREAAVRELEQAINEVKTLSGLMPICAACKKIRDDQGFWKQVEVYISAHSEAKFTHGICPDCARVLYPESAEESTSPS